MTIKIKYEVKFRAFGITFGTVRGEESRHITLPIPIIIPVQAFKILDRGVKIEVSIE